MQQIIIYIFLFIFNINAVETHNLEQKNIFVKQTNLFDVSNTQAQNNSVFSKNEEITFDKISLSIESFYLGCLIILLLINFTFFFNLRDKSYLLFTFYIISLIISELSIMQANFSLKIFSNLLSYAFFLFLIQKLLNLKNKISSLYKLTLYLAYLFILMALPILFSDSYYELVYNQRYIISFLFAAISLIITSLALKKGFSFSKYLFVSAIFIIAECLFILFDKENFLNYRIGTYISALVLAYSLLLHFINKLKDTQQQVIFNLEEMNAIKENANFKLDKKVKQRTLELQNANDLLSSQNREINTQKEEIESIVQTLEDANYQIIEQKELIEDVHSKITESINSASHIQAAMLPKKEIFEKYFSDFFIFYKPRDIVSGDFYWIKKIGNKIIVSAADCTGHGVPGAMVSMLGISLLTEIVRKQKVQTASLILDELRTALKRSLQQKGSENEAKEGIDMVLCIIDLDTKKMQFAGANNSMYVVRKESVNDIKESSKIKIHRNNEGRSSENILIEFKGNLQPIGAYRKERPFTNQEIQLFPEDKLYLFSDGFIDQFGGEKGYKFRTRPFKNLLLDIQSYELKEHKKLLKDSFNNWKNTNRQLDDVLIMGFKI